MAVFFALLTLIGWGVADVFATIAARKVGNRNLFFISQIFSTVLLALYIPFVGFPSDWVMFGVAILLGLLVARGTLFYFQALEVGNASLAGTIGGSFILPTVIFSVILFAERLSAVQIAGIAFVALGIILSSFNFKRLKKMKTDQIFSDRSVPLSLIAMLTWGIFYTLIRIPSEKIGWFWAGYPAFFFWIIMLLFGMVKRKEISEVLVNKKILLTVVMFTMLVTIAQLAYNLGILNGYTSIVVPIAGSYPVLFVILARIFFQEKLNPQQKVGVISSLVGIVLISFASI